MNFFEENGFKLKNERGNRVFPDSDKSSDVIKTLEKTMNRYGVVVSLNQEIKSVKKDKQFHILCDNNIIYTCDSLIVATATKQLKTGKWDSIIVNTWNNENALSLKDGQYILLRFINNSGENTTDGLCVDFRVTNLLIRAFF